MKLKIGMLLLLVLLGGAAHAELVQGALAPDFAMADQDGHTRTLADFKGHWLVLYFYPKDRTSGCTKEAENFTRDYNKFQTAGVQIAGVSLDDVASHKDFASITGAPFLLLSDADKKAARAYDTLLLGGIFTKRQTFIINPDGVIMKHYDSVDPEKHSAQLLQDLAELQKH